MQLTRNQIIIIGAVFVVVIIFAGLLIFGGRDLKRDPELSLVIWGTEDEIAFLNNLFGYKALWPNVSVEYKELNPATYEEDLLNALAAGAGPDVFMFKNTWLPKHFNKISPVGETQFGLAQIQQIFPTVVEQDFAPDGLIYALPLYIDTLALYYNQDIFDTAGIAFPPTTWLAFQNLIPQLRQIDTLGNITRAAAAIGGSSRSVDQATDILSLLMIQAGAKMTDSIFTRATFSEWIKGITPGLDALKFYTQFSDQTNSFYTWNDNLTYSLNSFGQGKAAMMLNYGNQQKELKRINPFLRFRIAAMPQPDLNLPAVNYASYWGLAVSNTSRYPEWAWDLIIYLTTDTHNVTCAEKPLVTRLEDDCGRVVDAYLKNTNRSPALRSLIQKYSRDPEIGVFAKQALTARSWPQIDEKLITNTFSQMIQSVINKQVDVEAALKQAERTITEFIQLKRQ